MTVNLAPPVVAASDVAAAISRDGYAVLSSEHCAALLGLTTRDLTALAPSWNSLPPDEHLRDGGHYRFRRHASFIVNDGIPAPIEHRAHWQPVQYNALHGGIERWFAPMEASVATSHAFTQLLASLAKTFTSIARVSTWFVEAHQFRIDTAGGIGRPTPEGAHRDGVDYVAVFVVQRRDVKGGETRVFEANGAAGTRFTITDPWSVLLLDDARVIHETTPIQPEAAGGVRDTLVVTFRKHSFQDRPPA